MQSALTGGIECPPHQPRAKSLVTIGGQDAHAERAAMGAGCSALAANIAPAGHLAIRNRHELRMVVFDHVENEGANRIERRRLQEAQIFPLARYRIESTVKAFNVLRPDGFDADGVGSHHHAAFVFALRVRCTTTFSIIRMPASWPSVMIDSGWN
ncbi:hypothetical protein D3C86_1362800 [compost metagenome]